MKICLSKHYRTQSTAPCSQEKKAKRKCCLRAIMHWDLTGAETSHAAREESLQEEPTTITEVMSQSVRQRPREQLGEPDPVYFTELSPLTVFQCTPWDSWQPTAGPGWPKPIGHAHWPRMQPRDRRHLLLRKVSPFTTATTDKLRIYILSWHL